MMNRFASLMIANGLLLFLTFAGKAQAFVAVKVELDPYIGSIVIPPLCTSTFTKNFESNLTVWVVNATRSISFLSDFKLPGGFHMTYLNSRRVRERSLALASTCTCTSAKCSAYCSIGTCKLCSRSRRRLTSEAVTFGNDHEQFEGPNATAVILSGGADEPFEQDTLREGRRRRRVDAVSWATVGASVTSIIKPYVVFFVATYANGCVGPAARLEVNVTFHSNVPIDTTMGDAIVRAFGVPATPPANAPAACCSYNFMNCVTYCGTTQTQCLNCNVQTVGWMWNGPVPNGTCIKRSKSCINNTTGCCKGLQCIGDSFWKGCFYVPPS